MSLPPEVRARYSAIIDSILENADLTSITTNTIRQRIQERVEYDITPQKNAIKSLIGERFDLVNATRAAETTVVPSVELNEPAQPSPQTNGVHHSSSSSPVKREAESDDVSDSADTPPPKKKHKSTVDADAAFAAKLQAEEDKRTRPTRGGATRKSAPAKKKKKKSKKDRITASDDSEVDTEGKETKPKRDTGFHKPLNLSPALSNLFDGETQMSRPQVTKQIWIYIKSNDLQDPSDKRYIICDARMRDVFRQDKVHMFTMTKLISQQLYNPDE